MERTFVQSAANAGLEPILINSADHAKVYPDRSKAWSAILKSLVLLRILVNAPSGLLAKLL